MQYLWRRYGTKQVRSTLLFYSRILFYSILFNSLLFCSVLFCSVLFYSLLFFLFYFIFSSCTPALITSITLLDCSDSVDLLWENWILYCKSTLCKSDEEGIVDEEGPLGLSLRQDVVAINQGRVSRAIHLIVGFSVLVCSLILFPSILSLFQTESE